MSMRDADRSLETAITRAVVECARLTPIVPAVVGASAFAADVEDSVARGTSDAFDGVIIDARIVAPLLVLLMNRASAAGEEKGARDNDGANDGRPVVGREDDASLAPLIDFVERAKRENRVVFTGEPAYALRELYDFFHDPTALVRDANRARATLYERRVAPVEAVFAP